MKIFFNRIPVNKPWGGGNKTLLSLREQLEKRNHIVVFNLNHTDINLLFVFDPRTSSTGITYESILKYKKDNNIKIIQRVGDLGFHNKPHLTNLIKNTIPNADKVIFISEYAYKNTNNLCKVPKEYDIINLAPMKEFYKFRNYDININKPIKIITHHWSNNEKKGFETYKYIDNKLCSKELSFTYIGNIPKNFKFINTKYIKPINAERLIKEIPKYDMYITSSIEETGGNHVLEAMGCGLPIIYNNKGGGIINYCKGFGIGFNNNDDIKKCILTVAKNFSFYKKNTLGYNKTLEEDVIPKYVEIFES